MAERIEGEGAGRTLALVLSGGAALGAYHAGACAALIEAGERGPDRLAGASIGAVTAAIITGNPPERRVERLRRFWEAAATDAMPLASSWLGAAEDGPWRRAHGWASAVQARLLGSPGLFRPRLLPGEGDAPGLYDLAPLRARLEELIDFRLLNGEEAPRLAVAATDIATGERVVFDTRRGTRIGPEHLVASSALLPDFAPVEIGGRLLGDGSLSAHLPIDLVLDAPGGEGDLVCFALDLLAREGERPRSLAMSAARGLDLLLSAQSHLAIEARRREQRLRAMIGRLAARLPAGLREDPEIAPVLAEGSGRRETILHLAYRASAGEPDFQKTFDFSQAALAQRWEAGGRDMRAALGILAALPPEGGPAGLTVHEIRP